MIVQRKIKTSLGKDTFIRNSENNIFKQQSNKTFQLIGGEIEFTEPEPLYKQNMVTVKFARDHGRATSVAYPGAFIDPISGNLHGSYEGPIPGQMVVVGFENGNSQAPFVVNRYPYQGAGNSFTEGAYINPLTKKLFDATDVIMGHFTGSFLSFNTGILSGKLPGSVSLNAVTDLEIESQTQIKLNSVVNTDIDSAIVNINGSTYIALNGTSNFAVKYTELKTAFDLLRTELNNLITVFNAHIHSGVTSGGGTSGVTTVPGVPATADMSASQNDKVLM